MITSSLTIATRESPLALWQASWVKKELQRAYPELEVHLLCLKTSADKMLETPLYKVGGKGLFVKELEEALFSGKADIAVHSMKDVPMELPEGLDVPVMCKREDPRDVLVSNEYATLKDIPKNAIIGTSSLRRQSQLLALRPDLRVHFLRGNVNTRLTKLDDGEFDAIILAAAGLMRLNLSSRIRSFLTNEEMLPAAGQGVLGIECRAEDSNIIEIISCLNDVQTQVCVIAERAMCRFLGGGCHVPIAACAKLNSDQITLRGLVARPDGKIILCAQHVSGSEHAEQLGIVVAEELLRQGAQEILDFHAEN